MTFKYLLLIATTTLIFFSIACTQRKQLIKYDSVDYWIGKKLNMPNYSKNEGEKYIEYFQEYKNADFKIVTYIDGNCPKCFDRLVEWKSIIEDYRNLSICFYFYVYSYDFGKIENGIKRASFSFPVIIESKNELFVLNTGLEDLAYRSFLLNDKDIILLVGAPLLNIEMRYLYDSIVFNKN